LGNTPTAERELVERFVLAARHRGWEAVSVLTSADILRFAPDCVLATHFTSPKLTEFPTLGLMTNPPEYFDIFPHSLANILSYDGYLTVSAKIRQYLADLLFSAGKKVAVSDFDFHLSCPRTEFVERRAGPRRLFYIGMRWDKGRHGTLFQRLAQSVALETYGPAERWADLPEVYRGKIPFDGTSILERIREAGAALCIHSAEHRAWGIPTMRIWEAAAAGAIIITDFADVARKHFGDAVLPIDLDRPEEDVVAQIAGHMKWINCHPEEADGLARQAHAIFRERHCLEEQMAKLPAFVQRVRQVGGYGEVGAASRAARPVRPGTQHGCWVAPDLQPVEYIVRAGNRSAHFLDRCLGSLREQSYGDIGVIVVPLTPRPPLPQRGEGEKSKEKETIPSALLSPPLPPWERGPGGEGKDAEGEGRGVESLQEVLLRYQNDFASFRVLPFQPAGARSHTLWAGLRAVRAPYFAVLDDDDRLHPNHVASLMEVLRARPEVSLVHSGGIRVQEEEGFSEDAPHLRGPGGALIGEDRRLECFANIDREAMLKGERVLLSHSWIARRELLDERILEDPNLPVLEDQYLHTLLILKGQIAFTCRPTAEWNWRSASRDNALFEEDAVAECRQRIGVRLGFLPEMEALRREEEAAQAVQQQLQALRQNFQAFEWMRSPEMLALRRSTQLLLLLRGLRRSLREWKTLRGRVAGGLRTVRKQGLRGFLSRMATLGRDL
jgi:phosphoglycerol transferase